MVDKLRQDIARGERARRVIEDEEVMLALEEVRKDIYLLWEKTCSDQSDEREMLYREIHGLKALQHRMVTIVANGTKAKARLEDG